MRFLNCQFRIPYTLGLAKDFSCGGKKKKKKEGRTEENFKKEKGRKSE